MGHGRSRGTVDSTRVLPPAPNNLSGICARCIPVASSGPSANDPLACPEARREPLEGRGFIPSVKSPELRSTPLAQPHPRKPFVVFLPSKKNVTLTCPLPLALIHLRNPLRRFASPKFTPFVYPEVRRALLHPRNLLTPCASDEPTPLAPNPPAQALRIIRKQSGVRIHTTCAASPAQAFAVLPVLARRGVVQGAFHGISNRECAIRIHRKS
jgi:hypothetical protein